MKTKKKTKRRSPIVVKRNGRKEVQAIECSTIKMVAGNEKRLSCVIDGGILKEWIGFGWVNLGAPNAEQKKKYPYVIRKD
jgi:hypothetical protein